MCSVNNEVAFGTGLRLHFEPAATAFGESVGAETYQRIFLFVRLRALIDNYSFYTICVVNRIFRRLTSVAVG